MRMLPKIIVARRIIPALGLIAGMTLLGLLANRIALPIRVVSSGLTHKIPLVELISLICVSLVVYVTRPQLWMWERLGSARVTAISIGVAVLAILAALPPVLIVMPFLPPEQSWIWLISNVLTIAGTAIILAVLCGPLPACFVTLTLYFSMAIIDNVVTGARPYLPLTSYPDSTQHWLPAIAIPLSAIILYAATRGLTPWVQRLSQNED